MYSRPKRCGDGTQLVHRAAFTVGKRKREFGPWSSSIQSTVASLLDEMPKVVLSQEEKDAAWFLTQKISIGEVV